MPDALAFLDLIGGRLTQCLHAGRGALRVPEDEVGADERIRARLHQLRDVLRRDAAVHLQVRRGLELIQHAPHLAHAPDGVRQEALE